MVTYSEKQLKPIDEFCPMWEVLTQEERFYLRENTKLQHFRKNEVIYCEGETPKFMMCLVTGKVKIYKDGVGGRSQIIRLIKPVDIFGYRAFFAKEPYLTSASTIESSSAYLVPMQVVEQIIQSNNKLALYFIQSLASDLGVDDARIVSLTQKHVRGRLAESLIMLRDTYGVESDEKTINSHLSREDLANYSNMTTSNAIRTLSIFASEGVIAVSGRHIQILDEEQLRKISKIG